MADERTEELKAKLQAYTSNPEQAHEYYGNRMDMVSPDKSDADYNSNPEGFKVPIDNGLASTTKSFGSIIGDLFGGETKNTGNFGEDLGNAIYEGFGFNKLEPVVDYVKSTDVWKKYTYNRQEVLEEADQIYAVTGIPTNAILASSDNLSKAREVMERVQKQKNLQDEDGNSNLAYMMEHYPALKNIADKSETQAAAILYDLKDVKEAQTIGEKAERIGKSIKAGLQIGKGSIDLGIQGTKGILGFEETAEDRERRKQIAVEMEQLQADIPDLMDNPLASVIGQTAQQGYRYLPAYVSGKVVGGIAGGVTFGVTKNPAKAWKAFEIGNNIGTALPMAAEIIGNKYADYQSMQTKDGKRLLTDKEAKVYAIIDGSIETGIEFWNYKNVMSAIGGKDKAAIEGIVKANKGNKEGIMLSLKDRMAKMWAASIKSSSGELIEESTQQIDNDFWHNVVVATHDNAKDKLYSISEMKDRAIGAAVEAIPSVLGMGVIGGGLNSVGMIRKAAKLDNMKKTLGEDTITTINGIQMLKDIKNNQASNNIFKKDKDMYAETIKGAVQGTEYAETTIDTELALEDEETMKVYNQVALEAGMSQEEIDAAIENKAPITVPTEIIAKVALPNSASDKLMNIVAFEKGATSLGRIKYEAERIKKLNDTVIQREQEQQKTMVDGIVETLFPANKNNNNLNEAYKAVASMIIAKNPSSPAQGWKNEMNSANEQFYSRIQPIIDILNSGMKNGVSIIKMGEENKGEGIRQSNNARWYSDFYKANKHAPTKRDLELIAMDIYSGNGGKYGPEFASWDLNNMALSAEGNTDIIGQLEEEFNGNKVEIEELDERIGMLNDIKGKMLSLDRNELALTKTLSSEAMQVYNTVKDLLGTAGSKQASNASKMGAILFARHSDIVSKALTESGTPITAMEYMEKYFGLNPNASLNSQDSAMAAQYNQAIEKMTLLNILPKAIQDKLVLQGKQLADSLNNIKAGKINNASDVFVCDTPDIFKELGFSDNKVIINAKDLKGVASSIQNKYHSPHKVYRDILKQIPKAITDPLIIMDSMTVKDRITVITDIDIETASGKAKIFIPFELNASARSTKKNKKTYANKIVSIYPRTNSNIENLIKQVMFDNSKKIYYTHEKKNTISIAGVRLQLPSATIKNSVLLRNKIAQKYGFVKFNQAAYHGTPHNFDSFDLGAIGTGEGAQAHGWGLYFAKDKKVSENYRKKLTNSYNTTYTIRGSNGLDYSVNGAHAAKVSSGQDISLGEDSVLRALVANGGNIKAAIRDVERKIKTTESTIKEFPEQLGSELEMYQDNVKSLKDALSLFKNSTVKAEQPGKIFEVDIPDSDVMLDEDLPLNKQPKKVREAIFAYMKENEKSYLIPKDADDLGIMPGRNFYLDIAQNGRGEKEASLTLNRYGIKGITYDGQSDGRCYVVFDDKAISIINKYNQEQGNIQGQIAISQNGKRIISLFETANESTFVHEMGHLALADLKMVAELENAPTQFVKDWNTVKEWIGWQEGQIDFTVEQQEKFARGFESYLRNGEAPTRGLKGVFRKFKTWLSKIYADFIQF